MMPFPSSLFSPLALILIPIGCLFLWPLVDRWLRDEQHPASPLQTALTAFALSVGLLAFVLFGLGLLPGRLLTGPAALVVVLAGLAVGAAINPGWFAPRRWRAYWQAQWQALIRLDIEALLRWSLLPVMFVVVVYALYYPFIGEDVLVRYGPQAQAIYTAQRLPREVTGYPPLVPLSFVATWFAANQPNEHLARLIPALMGAGMLGATGLIGRRLLGRTGGLLAALLVAASPLFVRNATLAYTDIPTAFPLALAVFYVLRWWDTGRVREAVLAGLLTGIALFTKQSALTWLASLAAVPVLWLLVGRSAPAAQRWRRALAGAAALLLPPLLIAGPWYLRNALLDGWRNILPIAGLYHLRSPDAGVWGLIPPLAYPSDFGLLLVPVFVAGWCFGLGRAARQAWQMLRGDQAESPADLILLLFVFPYWLAWWARFSFDSRFLLLVLPLLAVWSARPLLLGAQVVYRRLALPEPAWGGIAAVLLLLAVIGGTRDRLGGVVQTVTNPFASDTERLRRAKGEMVDLVVFALDNLDPNTDRLYLMDERLAYYLSGFDTTTGYPLRLSDLEGYDYLFHSSSIYTIYGDGLLGWNDSEFYRYAFDPRLFEPVYESGGVHVMRILRTDIPQEDK